MKHKFLVLLAILAVMCWAVTGAQATVTLFLNDNAGHTVTVADGSALDLSPAAGVVTYSGALGLWDINVSTGLSSSPLGLLDLNSIDRSTAAGHLTLVLSDTGFQVGNPTTIFQQIGGTTAGTVSYSAYYDPNNILFAQTTLVTSFTGLGSGGFSANFTEPGVSTTSPLSFTEVVDITHTSAGLTSFDASAAVPVPASVLLLGSGLLGLVGLRGFRKS